MLFSPWGDLPILDIPDSLAASPFVALTERPDPDLVHTAELSVLRLTGSPVGDRDTLRYSDRGWMSRAMDEPADTWFEGRIAAFSVEESVPLTPEQGQRRNVQVSLLSLYAGDRRLDSFRRGYAIAGQRVVVKAGAWSDRFAAFAVVADLIARNWQKSDSATLGVSLQDIGYLADMDLYTGYYGGTGGADGTADMKGKSRPFAGGRLAHMPLTLVEPDLAIYEAHCRQIGGFDTIYDGGSPRVLFGTYASYAALKAAKQAGTIPAGMVATVNSAAGSYVAYGSPPAGAATAALRGDAGGADGYVESAGGLGKLLLTDFSNGRITSARVNAASWAALAAAAPAAVQFYRGTEPVKLTEAIDQILASAGASWGGMASGQFEAGRLTKPSATQVDLVLDANDIIDVVPLELPDSIAVPNWRRTRDWGRNWQVLSGNQLHGNVSQSAREFFEKADRTVESVNAAVKAIYGEEKQPEPVRGLHYYQADAQTQNDLELDLYDSFSMLAAVRLKAKGYRARILNTVHVTWPAEGLDSGMYGRVMGRRIEVTESGLDITLTVWFTDAV